MQYRYPVYLVFLIFFFKLIFVKNLFYRIGQFWPLIIIKNIHYDKKFHISCSTTIHWVYLIHKH